MITLHAMSSPNVVKIYIALEETGLPYEVRPTDVFSGAQFDPEFLLLNPNAKVPVIVDSDGPDRTPYTVFESGAILLYLAEKTGTLLPPEGAARYDVIQWMMVQMTGLGPMFGQFVHFLRYAPVGNDYALDRYRTQVRRVLDVLEQRLARVPYLGGAEYSVADVATFPWARLLWSLLHPGKDAYPGLARWVEVIAARPAVQRGLQAVERVRGVTTAFDAAAPQDLDRMFGRGGFAAS